MPRLLVAGSLAYDRIMNFPGEFKDHFLPDKLHQLSVSFLIDRVTEEFGGTAGNIAYSLSLLDIHPALIGSAGTDFKKYQDRLEALGVDTTTLALSDELPTASAYIMTDMKDNQITAFAPGAGGIPYAPEIAWVGATLALVSATATADMERIPREAKAASVPVFFDPGQQTTALSADSLREIIEGASAVFVNDYELALIIEKTRWSEADIVSRVRLLVVTLGDQGSRLVTNDGETRVPVVSAKAVDPTGAGDAYRAGFIAGYSSGLSDEISAKIASTLAAYAVESHGTQKHTPTMAELAARFTATYSEPWPL